MEKNVRTVVTVSRYWHNPNISVTVSDERISLSMPIEDFVKAVCTEIDHPSLIVARSQLETKILACLDTVLSKVKESSTVVL